MPVSWLQHGVDHAPLMQVALVVLKRRHPNPQMLFRDTVNVTAIHKSRVDSLSRVDPLSKVAPLWKAAPLLRVDSLGNLQNLAFQRPC